MTRPLTIVVADDESDFLEFYDAVLRDFGHQVTATARSGRELIDHCERHRPDLLIVDVVMPGMDGINALREISLCCDGPIPAIIVSAHHEPLTLARAQSENVLAFLVKPVKAADLEAAIAIAVRRDEDLAAARWEVSQSRRAVDDHRTIAHATGLIMRHAGLNEQQAARQLRRLAGQKRPVVKVAQRVIRWFDRRGFRALIRPRCPDVSI